MAAPEMPLLLTFDVETDWGTTSTRGIDEALPRLLDALAQVGARATFFVVGDVAARFRRHVAPESGHEVGSHGLTHAVLTRLDEVGVRREITASKRVLEDLGYCVRGFRAPFLRRPPRLLEALAAAGYAYDSSGGSVLPSLCRRAPAPAGLPLRLLPPSTLRDGCTPFSLTWLRLLHPLGRVLVPARASVFFAHLHELLGGGGWVGLPALLRAVHAHGCGARAWRILESLLRTGRRFPTCAEHLELRA